MTTIKHSFGDFREALVARLVQLREAIDCDLITLHLYDGEQEQLYLPVGVNLFDEKTFYRSVPSMDRVAGKVIHARTPILADDAEHHPDMTGPFTHRERIKSAAGFPVKNLLTEEVLGVVFISFRVPVKFSEHEISKVEAWADETGIFIEQVLKSSDGKNLRFNLRRDAGHRQKVVRLHEILVRLREVLRNVDAALWLPQKGERTLVLSASAGIGYELFETIQIDTSAGSKNLLAEVFTNGKESSVLNFYDDAVTIFGIDSRTPWEKMQFFPIKSEYHSLGVLSVFRRDSFEFTNQDRDAITAFTSLLAVTIENEDRIITLNALHDLGVRLTLSQHLRDVLDEVVRHTCQIIGADITTLHLYDPVTHQFFDLDQAAVYPETARTYMEKPRSGGGLTSEILKKRRIYIEDVDKDQGLASSTFIKREGIKAYVGTPLVVNGDALGVFYVSFKYPRRFSPDELSLIQIMANYASTAVYRAKVTDQQLAVADIARDIVGNLDIGKILQTILERTLELLHCQVGSIALYNSTADELEFRYAMGKDLHRRIKLGKGLVGTAGALKEPVRIEDVRKDKRYVPIVESTLSELDVPLLVGDELVGVLNIESSRLNAFSKEDENLAMTLASEAAIAISNARLFEQAKRRADALKSLHDVTAELVSITNTFGSLEKILHQIANSAQQVLGADLVDIYQYWSAEDQFSLPPIRVGNRNEPNVVKEKIYPDDVLYKIIEGETPLFVQDAQSSQSGLAGGFSSTERGKLPRERFVVREKIKSSASLPMIVDNEVVGVLFVNYRSPMEFSSGQKELIRLFSNQAAIAIRNSRLFRESELRAERLNLVRQVASAVSSSTDVDEILQLVVNGLANVFEVKQSAVTLFDEEREYARVHKEYLAAGCVSAMGHKIPLRDNPQIDELMKTKKALVIDDVSSHPLMERTRDLMAERGTLSLMIVPIVIDNEVRGTIGIDAVGEKRRFTEEEAELAQAIADQAAAAMRISFQLNERLNDIRALQDITEQLHEGDLKEVLDHIADWAIELTGAKHSGVWLANKSRTALKFGGLATKDKEEKTPPDIPLHAGSEPSFSKLVFLSGKTHISGDVRRDENYRAWYPDTISELTVPIIYKQRVIGTINVESPNVNCFTEENKRLLEAMAGQAAVVVQNARLLEQLNVVDDIGVELTSKIHLREQEIIEAIYTQTKRLTDATDMYLSLYDQHTNEIRFVLATQKGERVEIETRTVDLKARGLTEDIIFTRKPILLRTKEAALEWYKQPGHKEYYGEVALSWLGVPMVVGDRVLGVIAIFDWEHEGAYDEQDLKVFSSMANQAAIALENATLYYDVNNKLERRVEAFAYLNTIGKELTSGLRLRTEEIVESIYTQAQRLTGALDMYISLYDEITNEIWFPLATENGERVQYPTRKADMAKRGKTEDIILNRHSILHQTKHEIEEWYIQPGHEAKHGPIQASWLGVPMIVGEKVLGVIAVYDLKKEHAYDELHLEVLSLMASQAAIALDNAILYYDVNQKLSSANMELEQKNIELRQAQEREIFAILGETAAGLIHKMSNTIGHVPALVKRIQKSIDPNEEDVNRKLAQISEGVGDALEYIGSMGKLLQMQKMTLTKEEAAPSLLISDAIRQTKEIIEESSIKLDENYTDLPMIHVNAPLVIEVFRNIIHNAVEAMPQGGCLTILGKKDENRVIITFMDTGSGIIEENMSSLFTLGFSTKKEGKGIGLWFSRKVVEQHQGTITVESEKDRGTTFVIALPVGSPASSSA